MIGGIAGVRGGKNITGRRKGVGLSEDLFWGRQNFREVHPWTRSMLMLDRDAVGPPVVYKSEGISGGRGVRRGLRVGSSRIVRAR